MARAQADLDGWVNRARDDISSLPDIPARDAFLSLCDYVVERSG
jgi:heptaprenyl diphosphate synthase